MTREGRLKATWTTESRNVEVYPARHHVVLRIVQPPRALEALLTAEDARGLALALDAAAYALERHSDVTEFEEYVAWAKETARRFKEGK